MTEPYVGAKEVAVMLNDMSPLTVKQWAKAGKIPGIKPGKEWLFQLSEVKATLDKTQSDPWAQSSRSRGRRRIA